VPLPVWCALEGANGATKSSRRSSQAAPDRRLSAAAAGTPRREGRMKWTSRARIGGSRLECTERLQITGRWVAGAADLEGRSRTLIVLRVLRRPVGAARVAELLRHVRASHSVTADPAPGSLAAGRSPRIVRASLRLMASPTHWWRAWPRSACSNASKTAASRSGGIPGPVSPESGCRPTARCRRARQRAEASGSRRRRSRSVGVDA
jgi:hypothetical protein